MMSAMLQVRIFAVSLLGVSAIEAAATIVAGSSPFSGMRLLLTTRCLQAVFLLWMMRKNTASRFHTTMPATRRLLPTLFLCLLMFVGAILLKLHASVSLPEVFGLDGGSYAYTPFFFLTACLVSPLAEELFFRGTIYGYFRQFGVLPALIISSLLFSGFHTANWTLPLLPLLGGVLSAAVYEQSRTLVSPFLLHSMGNLLIFFVIGAPAGG